MLVFFFQITRSLICVFQVTCRKHCEHTLWSYVFLRCGMPFYCFSHTKGTPDKPDKRLLHTSPGIKQDQLLNWPFRSGNVPWDCHSAQRLQEPTGSACKCIFVWLGYTREKNLGHTPSDPLKTASDTLDTIQMKAASFAIAKQRCAPLIMSLKHH